MNAVSSLIENAKRHYTDHVPGNAAYYRQRRHDAKARRLLAAVIEPTAERRARGDVVRLERQIADFVGASANTYRSLDTLELMERRGSIGPDERLAGDRFHNLFRRAALDSGFVVSDPTRIPVHLAGRRKAGVRGDETARSKVSAALDALGRKTSPHRACAWYVLGCEMSLTAWAAMTGWSEVQRIGRDEAGEILKKTLALLRRYWGI
jgi:hypothetical protein